MSINNTPAEYKTDYIGTIEYNPPSFKIRTLNDIALIFWNGIEIIGNIM